MLMLACTVSLVGVQLLILSCDRIVYLGNLAKETSMIDESISKTSSFADGKSNTTKSSPESSNIKGCLPRNTSFAALAACTYPRAAILVEVAVIIKCLFAGASYMTIAVEMVPHLISGFQRSPAPLLMNRILWTSLFTALVTPVVLMRRMDSLKYTSFLGLMGVFYLFFLGLYMFFSTQNYVASLLSDPNAVPNTPNIKWFKSPSFDMVSHFSTFVFSLTCHQNVFPLYNEYRNNSPSRMFRFVLLCFGVSSTIYAMFSVFMCYIYGDTIQSPVIESFSLNKGEFITARLLYIILMLFSIPIQSFPTRNAVESLFRIWLPNLNPNIPYYGATFAFLATAFTIAALEVKTKLLIKIIGCTAGTVICYVLPALFAHNLFKNESSIIGRRIRILAILLFIFAIPASLLPMISLIVEAARRR